MNMNVDSESRLTLQGIIEQKQYLENVLKKVSNKRSYINRTTSDRLSVLYNGFFDDFENTQEKCRRASINITSSIEHLTQIEELIMEINRTIEESKGTLNNKKVATLQDLVRTSILDNRPYFDNLVDIDYKEKDIENEQDSKNKKRRKARRRKKNYTIGDILERIGNADPGTVDGYFEEGEDEKEYDPYDYDPLWGTSTHPLTINPPSPPVHGGSSINSQNIYIKRKTKTNRSKNKRNKTKSNKKK